MFEKVTNTVLNMILQKCDKILLVVSAFSQSNYFDSKFKDFQFHMFVEEHFKFFGDENITIEEKKSQLSQKVKE